MTWAHWVLGVAAAYVAAGAFFAALFLARGILRTDPGAKGSHPAFFVLIIPGLIALWPVMLRVWMRATIAPPAPGASH